MQLQAHVSKLNICWYWCCFSVITDCQTGWLKDRGILSLCMYLFMFLKRVHTPASDWHLGLELVQKHVFKRHILNFAPATAMMSHLKISAGVADLIDVGQRPSVVWRPRLRQTKLLDLLKLHLSIKRATKQAHACKRFMAYGRVRSSGWKVSSRFYLHHCHCSWNKEYIFLFQCF